MTARPGTTPDGRSLFPTRRGPDAFWRVWRSRWRLSRAARRYFNAIGDEPEPVYESVWGECEGCDQMVERVGWDRLCFACQDAEREEDDERAQRLYEEDEYLYGI